MKHRFLMVVLLLSGVITAGAEETGPQEIENLQQGDERYRQYVAAIKKARNLLIAGKVEEAVSSLAVYRYTAQEGDTYTLVASRCDGMSWSTLVSFNRLSHPDDLAPGTVLYLPSLPGLYIPETPEGDLEKLMAASRAEPGTRALLETGSRVTAFRFLPGETLTATEVAFFLNSGFTFPLADAVVSSPYGPRVNPVTGNYGVHRGMDLAAAMGAAVYAARDGVVSAQGEDPVYGNYIIVTHSGGWASLYGHLSRIETILNQRVQTGTIIGRVGSTGQSTGPHLHFELRRNGQAEDPARLLRIFRGSS